MPNDSRAQGRSQQRQQPRQQQRSQPKKDATERIFEIADAPMAEGMSPVLRAEIDIAISTAKRYPRSVTAVVDEIRSIAKLNADVASSCFYAMPPRGDDDEITGPSVRFAEICASAWGNLRISAVILEIGFEWVQVVGIAHDLEKNMTYSAPVNRRILTKHGHRYSMDMIQTTTQAAVAIATRNATMKAVPRALTMPILAECMTLSITGGAGLEATRVKVAQAWKARGVNEEEMCAFAGVAGLLDIHEKHLIYLMGLWNRLKEGDTTMEAERERVRRRKEGRDEDVEDDGDAEVGMMGQTDPVETKPAAPSEPEAEREPGDDPDEDDGEPEVEQPEEPEQPATPAFSFDEPAKGKGKKKTGK